MTTAQIVALHEQRTWKVDNLKYFVCFHVEQYVCLVCSGLTWATLSFAVKISVVLQICIGRQQPWHGKNSLKIFDIYHHFRNFRNPKQTLTWAAFNLCFNMTWASAAVYNMKKTQDDPHSQLAVLLLCFSLFVPPPPSSSEHSYITVSRLTLCHLQLQKKSSMCHFCLLHVPRLCLGLWACIGEDTYTHARPFHGTTWWQ